ncbi:hypothetical protein [Luteolibacter sp. LG18]|uniref:hypothetical protein n=1 Tax=Luteolibacter sp. LG18 TaxID=2819286 RepID=UPI002B29193B|nr:hypothetical protein llg_41120 [Luteolibacter sp. LG18]
MKVLNQRPARFRRTRGFSLIITLLMMVLLATIALGLLGLSSITLRAAARESAMSTARANARLAMMMALGELQKQLGPDQRVSAPASALQPAVPTVHGDWKNATVVLKRTEDASFNPAESPKEKIKREFSGWLVSGEPTVTSTVESAGSGITGQGLTVVRSNGTASPEVKAGAVTVSTGANPGRYAWWVEDVGTKASLGLPRQQDTALAALSPDRMDPRKITGLESAPGKDSPLWDRLASTGTSELVTSVPEKSRGGSRSVAAVHRGVLTDTTRGRLRRDLSVALAGSRSSMETLLGEKVYEPVTTGGSDPGGPYWEQLRQYYQSGPATTLTVKRQTKDQEGYYPVIAGVTEMYGISNTNGFAPSAAPNPNLPPGWYNNGAGGQPNYVMTFHMSPVVKLWNPYDRPLNAPNGLTVSVANGNAQQASAGGDESYQDVILWGTFNAKARPPKTMRYEHRYFIPAHTLQPGETKVFALNQNRFLDLDGTYVAYRASGSPAADMGAKTVVTNSSGSGWILGELADVTNSGFPGYSFWDMMLTIRDVPPARQNTLNWQGGRAFGGTGANYAGDIQVFDSVSASGRFFQVVPHPFTTWNVKLFEGRRERPATGQADPEAPLVNIRNVNTDTTGFQRPSSGSPFYINPDPRTYPLFISTGANELWARRFTLKQAQNDGDGNNVIYNAAGSRTKDAKWLANFNPRSPTVGCWPSEANKKSGTLPTSNPPVVIGDFTGSQNSVTVNGTANGQGGGANGLGSPGNLLGGLVAQLSSVTPEALYLNKSIGFSDIGGPDKCVLFQSPATGAPERYFFSLGQLTHANLWIEDGPGYDTEVRVKRHSTEDWFADNLHPAYPIGNSYADPRLKVTQNQGRYQDLTVVDDGNTYKSTQHDLSYYLNRNLWDGLFFSARKAGGTSWNSRFEALSPTPLKEGEDGFRGNAAGLLLDGAFNINSTDPEAWAAFLASTCDLTIAGQNVPSAAYARVLTSPSGEVTATTAEDGQSQYTGFRGLKPDEIRQLSVQIVEQIKARGPATSLADFVNRSVNDGAPIEQRVKGALQAAIDATSINAKLRGTSGNRVIAEGNVDSLYETKAFAGDIAACAPGYLTQADLLTRLGGAISARSDTFVIRSRGEALDANGKVEAVAMLETTVQRMPGYLDDTVDARTEYASLAVGSPARLFGRAFQIVSTRWLNSRDI